MIHPPPPSLLSLNSPREKGREYKAVWKRNLLPIAWELSDKFNSLMGSNFITLIVLLFLLPQFSLFSPLLVRVFPVKSSFWHDLLWFILNETLKWNWMFFIDGTVYISDEYFMYFVINFQGLLVRFITLHVST